MLRLLALIVELSLAAALCIALVLGFRYYPLRLTIDPLGASFAGFMTGEAAATFFRPI